MADKSWAEWVREGMSAYRVQDYRTALICFRSARELDPDNPRHLSFQGLLMVLTDDDVPKGLELLQEAIKMDRKRGELYHNAFLGFKHANQLKKAFDFLYRGEKRDPQNQAIKKEFQTYGRRKPPVFSFLDRDNFLNKLLGKVMHRVR